MKNEAVILIKPHAYTDSFRSDVFNYLASDQKLEMGNFGCVHVTCHTCDQLYRQLMLGSRKTGVQVRNNYEYKELFPRLSVAERTKAWRDATEKIQIGDSQIIAKVDNHWVANGFYASMRDDFDNMPTFFFVVRFDISYDDFKLNVIGSTNSAAAMPGTLRHLYHTRHRPIDADLSWNGIHASAGALENVRDQAVLLKDVTCQQPLLSTIALVKGIFDVYRALVLHFPERIDAVDLRFAKLSSAELMQRRDELHSSILP